MYNTAFESCDGPALAADFSRIYMEGFSSKGLVPCYTPFRKIQKEKTPYVRVSVPVITAYRCFTSLPTSGYKESLPPWAEIYGTLRRDINL